MQEWEVDLKMELTLWSNRLEHRRVERGLAGGQEWEMNFLLPLPKATLGERGFWVRRKES